MDYSKLITLPITSLKIGKLYGFQNPSIFFLELSRIMTISIVQISRPELVRTLRAKNLKSHAQNIFLRILNLPIYTFYVDAPALGWMLKFFLILCSSNVWFKKTVTIHSRDTVLWIVTVFLNQTLIGIFSS